MFDKINLLLLYLKTILLKFINIPYVFMLALMVVEILFLNLNGLKKDCNGQQEHGLQINPKPFAPKKKRINKNLFILYIYDSEFIIPLYQ